MPHLRWIVNTSHAVYAAMISYIVYALIFLSNQDEWNGSILMAGAVIFAVCLAWFFVGMLRNPVATFGFGMFCVSFSFGDQAIANVPNLFFMIISGYHFLLMLPLIILDSEDAECRSMVRQTQGT